MASSVTFQRVVIDRVRPEVDGGRFPIKRAVGEKVKVRADIVTDGHDAIAGLLLYRHTGTPRWSAVPLRGMANDVWRASFKVRQLGSYVYTVCAWIDRFKSWRQGFVKRVAAGQDVGVEVLVGVALIEAAAGRAAADAADWLAARAARLRAERVPGELSRLALDRALFARMGRILPERREIVFYPNTLTVTADPVKARFSAWYEMFPRSCARSPAGTAPSTTARRVSPYVAGMGFDVLYLPPIHPIGRTHRKGPNNAPAAGRATRAAPGPSAPPRAGTRPSTPSSAPWRISGDSLPRPKPTVWRSPSTWPSSAPPTTPTSPSTRSGSASVPTGPSSTPKTPPRNTRTSTRSISNAPSWRALVEELQARRALLDRTGGPHLPGGQPPHQAASPSGSG